MNARELFVFARGKGKSQRLTNKLRIINSSFLFCLWRILFQGFSFLPARRTIRKQLFYDVQNFQLVFISTKEEKKCRLKIHKFFICFFSSSYSGSRFLFVIFALIKPSRFRFLREKFLRMCKLKLLRSNQSNIDNFSTKKWKFNTTKSYRVKLPSQDVFCEQPLNNVFAQNLNLSSIFRFSEAFWNS